MKDSFKQYFYELIGSEEAEAFFEAINLKETRRGLRVNTLKTDKKFLKEWLSESGYKVTESPYSKDNLEIEGKGELWSLKLPYYAGFTYPQDPSSSFVIDVLDPKENETIIDLTSAPGGKTTHIAQRMKNTGVLIANDMDTRRLKAVHSNLERLGIWNTIVLRMNAHKLSLMYPETFDKVLLDPSCSGEGLLNTYDGKPEFWSVKAIKNYSQDQFNLLCSAFRLLKPGGRLVYSTCTLNAIEDDAVIQKLLKKFPEAKIANIKLKHAPEQINDLLGIRFWPHKTKTKGFFCMAIEKTESLNLPENGEKTCRLKPANIKQIRAVQNELKTAYGIENFPWEWTERDGFLFGVSKELMSFELPLNHSLSFPIYKEERLTHAGAIYFGLHGAKSTEISADFLENIFNGKDLQIQDENLGKFPLLKYKNFPLGITKNEGKYLRLLTHKMF